MGMGLGQGGMGLGKGSSEGGGGGGVEMLTQLHVHPPFLPHPRLLRALAAGSCCSGFCDERGPVAGAAGASGAAGFCGERSLQK